MSTLDPAILYRALRSRDARFDGTFFVGVVTTGIYCRPICSSRRPKPGICRFFRSAAAAESEGFRPCLSCRPESAPGNAPVDRSERLALAAMQSFREQTETVNTGEVAGRLGITPRQLRKIFLRTFGVSPARFVRTERLLLSRQLLLGSSLSVPDVAMASGFESLRRFNELFRTSFLTTPSEFRKRPARHDPSTIELSLGFRPPCAWNVLFDFLGNRTIAGVEVVAGSAYRRAVRIRKGETIFRGWLSAEPDGKALRLTLSTSLLPVVPIVVARVRHLFDMDCRPDRIADTLGPLGMREPGIRVPGAFDGFETAVRVILGQQVSVQGARTLAGRLVDAHGDPVDTPWTDITRTFPSPERIALMDASALSGLGIFGFRIKAILGVATAVAEGRITLSPCPDPEPQMEVLRSIPGIGEWTVQAIAMRVFSWPDAFPHTDYGIRKALREESPRRILEIAEQWRPWRAYAALALWRSLAEVP